MKPAYLIVNADDFGYFDSVSRGIADAARLGVVTATGILATSTNLDRQVEEFAGLPELDFGVHLNLTVGEPLSNTMRAQFRQGNGCFTDKFGLAAAVLRRTLKVSTIMAEWRAQITRCLSLGIKVCFLNSHEHIHMLPPLFTLAHELALEFDIPYVRYVTADWRGRFTPEGAARNMILATLGLLNPKKFSPVIPMLGLTESGKLTMQYLKKSLTGLSSGGIYELMCHPGMADPQEKIKPRIKAYHDWDSERELLCSEAFREFLVQQNIRLIGFRDLTITKNHVFINEG